MKADPFKNSAVHGEWGFRIQALDADLRAPLLANGAGGVSVGKLFKGSAAETAGLKEGDIITAVNGSAEAVRTEEDKDVYKFYELMRDSPAGEKVALDIVRGGKRSSVELVTRAERFQQTGAFHTSFGFTAVDVTPEERNLYNIGASGVWVIFDNSKKDVLHHNLYNRTLVTHIDGAPTPFVEDFKKTLSDAVTAGKKGVVLTSIRTSRYFTEAFGADAQVYTLIRL
jgi:C-terminal processing protease CtpA/Prc